MRIKQPCEECEQKAFWSERRPSAKAQRWGRAWHIGRTERKISDRSMVSKGEGRLER